MGEYEEWENYDDNEADLIPGDNSLPLGPSDIPQPVLRDVPSNLSRIPELGGEIPISFGAETILL